MRLTINFLMKKARQKTNGEIPVYVRFTMNSKRVELSTGIYCHPDNWDQVGQQIRGRNETARILNNRLDKIQNEIQDHYNQLKSSGEEFNVTTIKNKLLNIDESKGILKIFDYYLNSILAFPSPAVIFLTDFWLIKVGKSFRFRNYFLVSGTSFFKFT